MSILNLLIGSLESRGFHLPHENLSLSEAHSLTHNFSFQMQTNLCVCVQAAFRPNSWKTFKTEKKTLMLLSWTSQLLLRLLAWPSSKKKPKKSLARSTSSLLAALLYVVVVVVRCHFFWQRNSSQKYCQNKSCPLCSEKLESRLGWSNLISANLELEIHFW